MQGIHGLEYLTKRTHMGRGETPQAFRLGGASSAPCPVVPLMHGRDAGAKWEGYPRREVNQATSEMLQP